MGDLQKDYTLSVTYSQDKDGNDGGEDYQFLRIETSDCGGGPYLLLETERWAIDIDEIDEFVALIKDIKEKYGRLQRDEEKEAKED